MTALALTTFDTGMALAERLRRYPAKELARTVGASPRTVENWQNAKASPTWKHIATMMQDAELRADLRAAAGLVEDQAEEALEIIAAVRATVNR